MATTKTVEEKKDEKFLVMIPPAADNEENFIIVGFNGKLSKLMRGVPIYVSGPIKAILDNSRVAVKVLEESKAKASKKSEKVI